MSFPRFIILVGLILIPLFLLSGDIKLKKSNITNLNLKKHPLEEYFSTPSPNQPQKRNETFNKLLILLVDFQEDDNPTTTGNGKFDLRVVDNTGHIIGDSTQAIYPLSLGAPPHNQEYYENVMQAVRYYYIAASLGTFKLEADIYPKEPNTAYTLPHTMDYYNPGMNNSTLMVERFEEYFHDIFSIADQDEDIVFSNYSHYMIIHAGSDWQHDVKGDSQHDIPSFFIQMGTGKEVYVDDNYPIYHACNVPETITQDIQSQKILNSDGEETGIEVFTGYGLPNAVYSHEFGHSLGFVDLYNTSNFRPMVGLWDIMDSGGSGSVEYIGFNENHRFILEGGIASLPSAWHRILVWGDEFKEMGVYKDISDFNLNEDIEISAAENLLPDDLSQVKPYFIRIPLNKDEYVLAEYRSVDPDGDGGINFKGAYPITDGGSDYRVMLHPTSYASDEPNYEYDWLLPGWQDANYNSFGGGLILWHIDNDIIYHQGSVGEDGVFVSNYQANSVNTKYNERGIKIIEADGIPDIGNPESLWWKGTAYEPFFKLRPRLNSDGEFIGVEESISANHNDSLSATTEKVQFLTNKGNPVGWRIYNISDVFDSPETMTFKVTNNVFADGNKIYKFDTPTNISDIDTLMDFPSLIVQSDQHYFRTALLNNQWFAFENQEIEPAPKFKPIINNVKNLLQEEIAFVYEHKIIIADEEIFSTEEAIIDDPLLLKKQDGDILFVSTESGLYKITKDNIEYLNIGNVQLISDTETVFAFSQTKLYSINPLTFEILEEKDLLKKSNHYPVMIKNINTAETEFFYITTDNKIVKISSDNIKIIFDINLYSSQNPSNLAIGKMDNGLPFITFGAGEIALAITDSGSLLKGFPLELSGKSFSQTAFPQIVKIFEEDMIFINNIDNSTIAFSKKGEYRPDASFAFDTEENMTKFYWLDSPLPNIDNRLFMIHADKSGSIYSSYIDGYDENPISWKGKRNGLSGCYFANFTPITQTQKLSCYAYPNPIKSNNLKIRVYNSKNNIRIKIYDLAGNLILDKVQEVELNNYQDVNFDVSNIASGVYFAIVSSGNETKKIKFGIEK